MLERTVLRSVTRRGRRRDPPSRPRLRRVVPPAPQPHQRSSGAAARQRRIPVITVITDLVDIHAAWACPDVDAVVVPSPGGFERCRRAGIPASRCHDLGLAVDRRFTDLPSDAAGIAALRRAARVAPGQLRRARLRRRRRIRRDRAQRAGDRRHQPSISTSWSSAVATSAPIPRSPACARPPVARCACSATSTDMPQWMRASDVVVSKAGPGTIAEALCCGLPLLLVWYLPGQERGNVEWVVDIGAGRFVPHVEQLIDAVTELAVPGSATLAAMREAVRAAARPDATRRIAELIASMAATALPRERVRPRGARSRVLRVHCFRNYAEATVRFGPGLNIIHGQNAQGKTNLLEAIATLALTRSPRATTTGDLLLWGHDEGLAEADIERPPANVTLAARFQRDPVSGRVTRTAIVDGKPRAARSVLGVCPGRPLLAGGSCARSRRTRGPAQISRRDPCADRSAVGGAHVAIPARARAAQRVAASVARRWRRSRRAHRFHERARASRRLAGAGASTSRRRARRRWRPLRCTT